jgi:hypothetical protein
LFSFFSAPKFDTLSEKQLRQPAIGYKTKNKKKESKGKLQVFKKASSSPPGF